MRAAWRRKVPPHKTAHGSNSSSISRLELDESLSSVAFPPDGSLGSTDSKKVRQETAALAKYTIKRNSEIFARMLPPITILAKAVRSTEGSHKLVLGWHSLALLAVENWDQLGLE